MYFWERSYEIRDSDGKSAGCGILVKKERECGNRTPPSRPCRKRPALVATTFLNSRGGRLRELRLYFYCLTFDVAFPTFC